MRHGIAGNRLGRNQTLRKATVRDLAKATLLHQRILTTKIKAKEARKLVDQLITLGKKGTLSHRRKAFSILCDHQLVSDLFAGISKRFHARQGGYTRIISLGRRRGDNSQMAYLELTEKSEVIVSKPKSDAVAKSVETAVSAEKKKPATASKPGKATPVAQDIKAKPKEKPSEKPQKTEIVPPPPPAKPQQPRKDLPPVRETPKPKPNFVTGLKKMFTKKPSGGK